MLKRFFVMALVLFGFSISIAANILNAAETDRLEITIPAKAETNQAVDIKISALLKDWSVNTDFKDTIYISAVWDDNATVPYSEVWYEFKPEDNWVKTFSKWLSFTKTGNIKVEVIDLDDTKIEWTAIISVNWTWDNEKISITFDSPKSNVKVVENNIKLSIKTRANTKVSIQLNWVEIKSLLSNWSWKVDYNVTWLDNWDNILAAQVLNSSWIIAGQTEPIIITVDSSLPSLQDLIISEWTNVKAGQTLNITAKADAWLKTVLLNFEWKEIELKEKTSKSYTWTLIAPSKEWKYWIWVSLESTIWKKANYDNYKYINVTSLDNPFVNIKAEWQESRIILTWWLTPDTKDVTRFRIFYKKEWVTDYKNIITYPKNQIKQSDKFTWYIPNLEPWKYVIYIEWIDESKKLITWYTSMKVYATVTKAWPWTCTIDNISGLKVVSNKTESVISWDNLDIATWYNIYKKNNSWDWVFLTKVKDSNYTVHISWDKVKYEDYSIKWICKNWEWLSPNYTATKVKTWPMVIIYLIIAFGAWLWLAARRIRS